jgi:hypothetical protein
MLMSAVVQKRKEVFYEIANSVQYNDVKSKHDNMLVQTNYLSVYMELSLTIISSFRISLKY